MSKIGINILKHAGRRVRKIPSGRLTARSGGWKGKRKVGRHKSLSVSFSGRGPAFGLGAISGAAATGAAFGLGSQIKVGEIGSPLKKRRRRR